jgi:hypothetical protein
MEVIEYVLFNCHKTKGEKDLSIQQGSFIQMLFTVQYPGVLHCKNTVLRIQAATYHFLLRPC